MGVSDSFSLLGRIAPVLGNSLAQFPRMWRLPLAQEKRRVKEQLMFTFDILFCKATVLLLFRFALQDI